MYFICQKHQTGSRLNWLHFLLVICGGALLLGRNRNGVRETILYLHNRSIVEHKEIMLHVNFERITLHLGSMTLTICE